ncbi:zinc-activated ligand-gated ion channel [Eublepharis macularius]|uniref:Zinc-activated ligand-gated ion channel n=1 Tax=Eublepharis macularius TaxID=481883 RepID=A0AA97J616_EUBMA|nr:zinc-activated ligand-gated ion channel [Eublepharis macularius]
MYTAINAWKEEQNECTRYYDISNYNGCIPKPITKGEKAATHRQALSQTTWENFTTSSTKELLGSLLDTYSLYQIPRNGSDPLLVTITVSVSNVLNVSWYNKQLAWDETDFPFSSITVPWDSVWTPSHSVREAFEVEWTTASPDVVLHSDGKVEFQLSLRIDSNCNFDLFYFPRDKAHCTLSFFFMDNTVNELEFKVSTKNEILNVKREYLVTGVNATSQWDTLQVQPLFVVMIDLENTGIRTILSLIVPSIALMIADLCGFLLPLKDRPSYMVTLLLAYLVFHASLVGSLPGASSCNPLLSYYYIGLLVLLFLSTIETILVTKLVADNHDRQLKHIFRGATATTTSAKNESDRPEDKNSRMNDYGTEKEESNLNQVPATLDRLSFFIFLGLVVIFHLLFAGLWLLWKCESEKPPGEGHLDGIKNRQGW